ncbi:hypothetical protein ACFY8S_09305 [Streptomyces hygroscopicus]|uniref:hypothetical protein n=1 Tax=Streptomyces hygroscopicus TaxID=1912 RepID=UPI0036B01B12
MSIDRTERPPATLAATSDNRLAVVSLIDRTGLPAPTLVPRPDAVHIVVTDPDDLGEWLDALGGEIHISAPFEGVETWTLHTKTEPRADGTAVALRVSVAVVAGELVMDYIRAAVTA